ncbi:Chloromuconate cycloisomerase [Achromobacter animicus]|uniref:enolase C-terminal domain-like protein n=1 Tax=Achromobacter animicus TaxID=1389935 RepID=UPI0014686094|nr:enolase C-terminal domain-like protein [Achromobacter animicus]CAB3863509.1 Chloromuconate cycloisomerase [Achromobacter animicus]
MIRIHTIETQRLNLRLRKPLSMSFGDITDQQVLLIRTTDTDGVQGVGEAYVMGGPYWNADTIEGTHAVVTRYAAPWLEGREFADLAEYSATLHRLFRGNGPARTALEMSFLDLAGKKSGRRAVDLLGDGAKRARIPVSWTLGSDDLGRAIQDGEQAITERGHRLFKLKVGIVEPESEALYAGAIARHFEGRARVLVDANQAWARDQVRDILLRFQDAGVAAVEQPMAGHDPMAMARIRQDEAIDISIIADEPLIGPATARLHATHQSASAFSLKPQRDGGLMASLATAEIAQNAGILCYGGTMLETSVGTAALAALYAAVPDLSWGSELFGPLRLDGDTTTSHLLVRDGCLELPTGPGLGVTLDEDRIRHLDAKF